MYEDLVFIESEEELRELFGNLDAKINFICDSLGVKVSVRNGNHLTISGNKKNVKQATRLIEDLLAIIRRGNQVNLSEIKYQIDMVKQNSSCHLNELYNMEIQVFKKDKIIRPKTFGQKQVLDAINTNEILFVIGPAGTGKTYLAVAIAISALKKKEIDRIILVRPAVEAGESLGFLPGDLMEKIDPYFRPLYDAINEMMPYEKFQKFLEQGIVEVAPLAYMRGRTLNNSFIILDDAQNTTLGQMKMFLTRFGFGSKIIVTGDITQVDLPQKTNSGLISIAEILKDIQGIEFIYLEKKDVVRHRLVKEIILAYEKASILDENHIKNLGKNKSQDENR
ncbi:MAG: PhoH family protein [Candidatus Atribacteria bacterium]|nr:PhoH family protein [Candidatus Atribacteria bacterium]